MAMRVEKGLALQDMLSGLHDIIEGLELPINSRVYILDQLAHIE